MLLHSIDALMTTINVADQECLSGNLKVLQFCCLLIAAQHEQLVLKQSNGMGKAVLINYVHVATHVCYSQKVSDTLYLLLVPL